MALVSAPEEKLGSSGVTANPLLRIGASGSNTRTSNAMTFVSTTSSPSRTPVSVWPYVAGAGSGGGVNGSINGKLPTGGNGKFNGPTETPVPVELWRNRFSRFARSINELGYRFLNHPHASTRRRFAAYREEFH